GSCEWRYCLTSSSDSHLYTLHSNRTPPHLHSFPTRRSSDLSPTTPVSFSGTLDCRCSRKATALSPHRSAGSSRRYSSALRTFRRDRKSTRLNSSHRTISYAVFCLKKKKKLKQDKPNLPDFTD